MLRHTINTVATALAVMYLAIRLQLRMPQIAMVCVFIVMQPQAKSVLAKGFYRWLGTIAGAIAAWALASLFASSTAAFLVALGVWVSLLTIIASFSAQLRAYSIVLTGYTPILIGITAIAQFGYLAADAAARLAEVGLGTACAAAAALLAGSRNTATQNPAAPAAKPSPRLPSSNSAVKQNIH